MLTAADLKEVAVFSEIDEAFRNWLAQSAGDLRLEPGEFLVREGEKPYFFVLLEGTLQLVKEVMGRPTDLVLLDAGAFYGELEILLDTASPASLRAKTKCRVARFDARYFRELIQKSPTASSLILNTVTERLHYVKQYVHEQPTERVTIVGSQYNSDCREIRAFLSLNRIPYAWVDRSANPERVPGCLASDQSALGVVVDGVNCIEGPPTIKKVAKALGLRTTPSKDSYDVVVIGGGPAGLAAAVYGASEGLNLLLVERNAAGGQAGSSSRIENYLGFPNGISGDELSDRALKQATRFGAEIVLTREVVNVERLQLSGYRVVLDGDQWVNTQTVILATGVEWRHLEVDGVDKLIGQGVLYGASRTEAPTVVGKDIFIVGGGNSAGQAAKFFADYANSVTLLVRGDRLETSMSRYLIEQLATKANIAVETSTQVRSVHGDMHLEAISTKRDDTTREGRKADALFVLIGANAKTSWLPKFLQRDKHGYIRTGRDVDHLVAWPGTRSPFLLEANLPGFFCVGDVRHGSIKRVSSGVGEGSMAIAFVHQYLALLEMLPAGG